MFRQHCENKFHSREHDVIRVTSRSLLHPAVNEIRVTVLLQSLLAPGEVEAVVVIAIHPHSCAFASVHCTFATAGF